MIVKLLLLFKLLLYIVPTILIYFVAFLIAYKIHIIHKKKREDACENNKSKYFPLLNQLNFLYVKNIKLELLKMILLFSSTIGLIILLRILNFGKTYSFWGLFTYKLKDTPNFIMIIIFIIVMYFYIKMLHLLLKDTFYKIHLYFYNNKIYFYYMDDFWFNAHGAFSVIVKVFVKLNLIFGDKETYASQAEEIIYLKTKIMANKTLKIICTNIYNFVNKYFYLQIIEKCFYYYLPHIFVFSILLYDLKNNEIKYFYYSIFIFFIINLYRRFKVFTIQLDFHEIDKLLANYFYQSDIHNQMMLEKDDYKQIQLMMTNGYAYDMHENYGNQFKAYFKRGYIVDYIDIHFKKSYEPHNIRILYILIFISYFIFCYNISTINCVLISIPLVLAILVYEYCFYIYKKIKKYIIPYMVLYILLFGFSVIIFGWIYLTRHTLYFMNDSIWNYRFTINQHFTIDEKILYLKEYFAFKIQSLHTNQKLELITILKSLPLYELLQSFTIAEIKDYVDNLIIINETLENKIYPSLQHKYLYKQPESTLEIILNYLTKCIKLIGYR